MNVRFAGTLLAVSVSLATVLIPRTVSSGSIVLNFGELGLFGAPVAASLGWWLTASVVKGSWRHAAGIGLGMGIAAAYLGVLATAYVALVGALLGVEMSTGFSNNIEGSLFIAMIGLPFGTLALPVTIPCGLVWAGLVRGLLRRLPGATHVGPSPIGVSHVALVLLVVAVGAAIIPIARSR